MGAKKISALTAASLPLTGAETMAGVQGGATVKFTTAAAAAAPYILGPYGSAARSDGDRWGEKINPKEYGGTWDGASSNTAQFDAAILEVVSRGRGTIIVPQGLSCLVTPPNLAPLVAASVPFQFEGPAGSDSTIIKIRTNSTLDWFKLGDATGTRHPDCSFKGFTISNNAGHSTSGAIFGLENCNEVRITDVKVPSVGQILRVGTNVVPPDTGDSVFRLYLDKVYAGEDTAATVRNFIDLVSASHVDVSASCFFNGGGTRPCFGQSASSTRNTDGLYVTGGGYNNWSALLDVRGQGISNLRLSGGISDRSTTAAVLLKPADGGLVRSAIIALWNFDGNSATVLTDTGSCVVVDTSAGGGASVQELIIVNNVIFGYGGNAIKLENALDATVEGNVFRNCAANTAVATGLISVGSSGDCTIALNRGRVISPVTAYPAGVAWSGSTNANRFAVNNNWKGATTDHTGTP